MVAPETRTEDTKMKKLMLVALIGIGAVVGWPMVKDAAVDRALHVAHVSASAKCNQESEQRWVQACNALFAGAVGRDAAVAELESKPLDRQIEFVIDALVR
jgi:hypothetical protein